MSSTNLDSVFEIPIEEGKITERVNTPERIKMNNPGKKKK